ncbi:thioredoxin domain-containing protein [Rhizosphaericola mali]|uniref:Thioredoxin domain-containing protein n=1 Tax=Rhizosphaericola mali TaxID=2545455 RepID=A0A5P2G1X0_9BACT|nr:thioredoxin domain-containing protein [Rhizosphaericola mali]QES89794.1 thioredoxin domain-containing protein [Rhizosphaericola mali]
MSTENKYTNKLVDESSPYLLQHAHNPVNWYPWGEEALEKAKTENKPILLSIGYAACHWCHVMAHESFENEETAHIMNDWFINIKVDREERPDLDQIYMDALQAMNGNGGWPLNVFLTPELKPFYGGTYFPPQRMYNRLSWTELLATIHDAFYNRKDTVDLQANNLMQHLQTANTIGTPRSNPGIFSQEHLDALHDEIQRVFDSEWGGFSQAPKFLQTFSLLYELRHYYYSQDVSALNAATFSLDKMIAGGIYDQIRGGISRYSTDKKWQAPHFEKMLYDNALFISTLSEAYALTKNKNYKCIIEQSIAFINAELRSENNGFYSSIDADSEGIEGKFYTWTRKDIADVLGEDTDMFCKIFDIWEEGNWEHTNILWKPERLEKFVVQLGIPLEDLEMKIRVCSDKLLSVRNKRIRPATDDKFILYWNALMIKALCQAGNVLKNEKYIEQAILSMDFLENNFIQNDQWLHSWKNNSGKIFAFLDDYASLIDCYIHLHESTNHLEYLNKAIKWVGYVEKNFSSLSTLFFYTSKSQTDIVLRKKDIYDSATASGNAIMATNLNYLGNALDKKEWKERAAQMLLSIGGGIVHYPISFGQWALLLQTITKGYNEIAIVGENYKSVIRNINEIYIPNKILFGAITGINKYPLLADKSTKDETLIYLCENYNCKTPVKTIEAFKQILPNYTSA